MLKLRIRQNNIEIEQEAEYNRGTVGAKVNIIFDDFWTDFEKTVVFKRCYSALSEPINVIVNDMDTTIDIPPEILAESGKFRIGVFGIKDNIVWPTLYSKEFDSRYATDTKGKSPNTYTPSEIDQLRISKQDKLTAGSGITIKDNVISVSGGSQTVDFTDVANALKGNKSGETVVLDDISPLEHNISVKVENSEKLIVSGKNLVNVRSMVTLGTTITKNGVTATLLEDGAVRVTGTPIDNTVTTSISFLTDKKWILLPDTYSTNPECCEADGVMCFFQARSAETNSWAMNIGNAAKNKTYQVTQKVYIYAITVYVNKGVVTEIDKTYYPSLERNDTFTGYEPYVEPITYSVNADGTVDGVKSIYPTTVLFTDTEGATIEAEYNKDINKSGNTEKWRTIQHLTLTEDTNSIIFSADSEGNPFNLKKARVIIKGGATHARLNTFINESEYVNVYFYTSLGVNAVSNYIYEIGEVTNALRFITLTRTSNAEDYLLADSNVSFKPAITKNRYGENTPISHLKLLVGSGQYFLSGTEFIFEGVDEK